MIRRTLLAIAILAGLASPTRLWAQETIKIGVILPFSGQFADSGVQIDNGIKLYMQQNGDTVGGRKIEIVRKDVGGIAPDVAKRLAQELLLRDKVDILAGFSLTPNAMAAGDVSQQAKKFMVVMNAATSAVTDHSQYMVRVSLTTPQLNDAFGRWVYKSGVRHVFTMSSDYGPGQDAVKAFEGAFKSSGGEIVGSVRMPVDNPDFSAFVQRAKDSQAEAIYAWVPGGTQPGALGKALAERGVNPTTNKILGQGELALADSLKAMGDASIGIVTAFHYDPNHDSNTNRAFVAAYQKAFTRAPDIYSVGGYDGMHLIYDALKKADGKTDGASLVEAAKGDAWESPRGPVSIDPETREIIQTVWIRRVEKVDGQLKNVEFDRVENARDPTKAAASK